MTLSTYVSIKVVLYLLALHLTPTGPHRDLYGIQTWSIFTELCELLQFYLIVKCYGLITIRL